ncbi:MAG TPA: M56 family metallopeptidase [Pseudomonadales bacterium]
MILGYPAMLLNAITIALLGMIAAAMLASVLVCFWADQLPRLAVPQRRRLLWCVAGFPFSAALVAVLLSLLPEWQLVATSVLSDIIHWHHVYLFAPVSWHGFFLLAGLLAFFSMLVIGLAKAVRDGRRLHLLKQFGRAGTDSLTEIDAPAPMAFASGLWRPQAFITTGLSCRIAADEREIICLHEQAHVSLRDPLKKYVFSLLLFFYLPPVRRLLKAEFDLVLEQTADDWVLSRCADRTAIASTLVKVMRLKEALQPAPMPEITACYFAACAMERRIRHLLGVNDYRSLPLLLVTSTMLGLLLASAVAVDLLHHLLETVFLH